MRATRSIATPPPRSGPTSGIRLHRAAPSRIARTAAERAASSRTLESVDAYTVRTGPKATGPDQDHCRDDRDGPGHGRDPAAGMGDPAGPDLDCRRRPT